MRLARCWWPDISIDWLERWPAWQVTHEDGGVRVDSGSIAPGDVLVTDARQSMAIAVARIGRITLSPQSTLRLLETRSGKHRVSLDSGHLRARIWAPPGTFGVTDGTTDVIDLGCDFDMWKYADGSARVYVRSGWIAWRVAAQEILLPAGFGLHFDAQHASTPLRPHASPAFASAVEALEKALAQSGQESSAARAAADAVASEAEDADGFTLLSLLSQHPQLVHGKLYDRLARALGTSGHDESHRAAWAAGDHDAINAWWQRMPTQPKHWWANWSDIVF